MIDPALALQTAVRETLIASPAVAALVPENHVRAGAIRPDRLHSIILADARTEYLGVAAGSQRLARVFLTLHVWAQESAQDTARQIGAAVHQAIEFGPKDAAWIAVDEWFRPTVVWIRDPQPEIANMHGTAAHRLALPSEGANRTFNVPRS